jgi:hypothetical protein
MSSSLFEVASTNEKGELEIRSVTLKETVKHEPRSWSKLKKCYITILLALLTLDVYVSNRIID